MSISTHGFMYNFKGFVLYTVSKAALKHGGNEFVRNMERERGKTGKQEKN